MKIVTTAMYIKLVVSGDVEHVVLPIITANVYVLRAPEIVIEDMI